MFETIEKEKINSFKNNLSKCVNVTRKAFTNKQLIISNFSRKNLIGFIRFFHFEFANNFSSTTIFNRFILGIVQSFIY